MGFRIRRYDCDTEGLARLHMPCVALVSGPAESLLGREPKVSESFLSEEGQSRSAQPAIVARTQGCEVFLFEPGTNEARTQSLTDFESRYIGIAFQIGLSELPVRDDDGARAQQKEFGFQWFLPELLKHKSVWRDVLCASLVIQILALATPLFTQVVIDKVVVHRTLSTLIVIGLGLAVFMIFTGALTWVRQYLVLHTGNRVDAVLGASVFEHLFQLPLRYFQHRPTGVLTARLRGVENIREFIASAAVTLLLDLPFLLIFVAVMFYYSVVLTLVSLSIIGGVVVLSMIVAPVFRSRMNQQFLLGARNQAFATEYIGGLETVKSLQMEPQVNARYADLLAGYMRSGFEVRQLGNTYNVFANGLEQLMTLLILVLGAYTVMTTNTFTIGMLVAFQMFASRVSQPMLKLVGLWQQFQQASLSVVRLGDIMNAPIEPYSLRPTRARGGDGSIEIRNLSFRYADDRPMLYEDFQLSIAAGKIVAIMGPSGSGKSTLAKLLQGFYQPVAGTIRVDGTDIRFLSANELRANFGVVPQETVLFSGTVFENLRMANAHTTFEEIVKACQMAEIHAEIEALPSGYQTEIGERGVGLSGGQKQRIAIARALLKRPKILVFDEATSSLDPVTAEHFAGTVNRLKGSLTMLFITHNLPRSLQVDDVVRIERRSAINRTEHIRDATAGPRATSGDVMEAAL
jgi:subfamily B ATP-binding cassette protein HlyB/CyaB